MASPATTVSSGVARPKAAAPSWKSLPMIGRCYVTAIIWLGIMAIAVAIPQISDSDAPLLTALAVMSFMTAFAKTTITVPGSASTLSLCYVIDFTTLLVLGPSAATLTAAAGVWSQTTFRAHKHGPKYRSWFSIAALALTVRTAGLAYTMMGQTPGVPTTPAAWCALAVTAAVYFVANTILIAGAVALTTRQRTLTVWSSNFASIWQGHLLGFTVAVAAAAGIARSKLWIFPFTLAILALTYEKLHAYVEGLSESLTDPMTELPNLRYLRMHAAQEIDRARRQKHALAVLMIDLNDFKAINDSHGHRAGDLALCHVAARLQSSVRSYDICARYAGDEFVVLLPGCNHADAQTKADVLQRAIADSSFEPAEGVTTSLNISVGFAVYPNEGETFDELLTVADRQMFRNKQWKETRVTANVPTASRLAGAPLPV